MQRLEKKAILRFSRQCLLDQRRIYHAYLLRLPKLYRPRFNRVLSKLCEDRILLLNGIQYRRRLERIREYSARRCHNRVDFLLLASGGILLFAGCIIFAYICLRLKEGVSA
jgi:hypothetical protein